MNHENDESSAHHSDVRCQYQAQFDNRIFTCRVSCKAYLKYASWQTLGFLAVNFLHPIYPFNWLIHIPWVSEFHLTISTQNQADKWWELGKNVIKEIISWSKTKLSNYCNIIRITWQTPRRIAKWRSWEWKGYCIAYSYSYWFLVSMVIVCLLVNLASQYCKL